MKSRSGFVSNSSSSSFIVAFPKHVVLNTIERVHAYFFPGGEGVINPYGTEVTTRQAAEQIFNQLHLMRGDLPIKRKRPLSQAAAIRLICEGHPVDVPYFPDYPWREIHAAYDAKDRDRADELLNEYYARRKEAAQQLLKSKKWGNYALHDFVFADEDGDFFAALEHGSTFDNVDHIRISCH